MTFLVLGVTERFVCAALGIQLAVLLRKVEGNLNRGRQRPRQRDRERGEERDIQREKGIEKGKEKEHEIYCLSCI